MDPCCYQSGLSLLTTTSGLLNHVLILDASESMTNVDYPPSRMRAALAASVAYAARLLAEAPHSRLAVVMYSNRAHVLCPLAPVKALKPVDHLHDTWCAACETLGMGATNMGAGVEQALSLVSHHEGKTQAVLLTDGHHNTGQDPVPMAARLRRIASLATVGIGKPTDVNQALLKQIASTNSGGEPYYRWLGDTGALVRGFVSLAGGISRS